MAKILLFFCFIVGVLISDVVSSDVRVDPLVLLTTQGLIRGQKATDGDYSTFLGVPYAQVDPEDPFGPSKAQPAFQEIIYNARDGSVKCPQMGSNSENESLDCLRLNIFVPNKASSSNPLPVMVWIHGGEFERGSAGEYGARDLVNHDIVVVAINYRLGPYGFMCLDTPTFPGNQGLKDQYTALSWIKTNIAAFGGNPYNVTLAGQDAGAASVLLHLYSSKDKLYHKAIVQSGTPQSEGMFVLSDVNVPQKLAEHLGLQTNDTAEALEFLKNTSHELVTAAAYDLKLELRPCKERSFSGIENIVDSDPYSLTNQKKVSKTPILIGYTSHERDSLSDDYYNSNLFYNKLKSNFNFNDQQLEKAAKTVKQFYIGDNAVSDNVGHKLQDFETDFVYHHPTERMIEKLLNEDAGAVYNYMFSYEGTSGTGHSAELNYVFNIEGGNVLSEEDKSIANTMTTLWTNFVKYGNPTPRSEPLHTWTQVSADTRPTLIIDSDIRIENRVNTERMSFWDLFYSVYNSYNTMYRQCSIATNGCC